VPNGAGVKSAALTAAQSQKEYAHVSLRGGGGVQGGMRQCTASSGLGLE